MQSASFCMICIYFHIKDSNQAKAVGRVKKQDPSKWSVPAEHGTEMGSTVTSFQCWAPTTRMYKHTSLKCNWVQQWEMPSEEGKSGGGEAVYQCAKPHPFLPLVIPWGRPVLWNKYFGQRPEKVLGTDQQSKERISFRLLQQFWTVTIHLNNLLQSLWCIAFHSSISTQCFSLNKLFTKNVQVSSDWWRGNVGGKEGLIPDKYILLKIRGEDEARDSLVSFTWH